MNPDDRFAALAARFDPPLVIVTTAAQGRRAGCVVGFHGQSSIDPARYAVWISKANLTYRVALLASHLVVHRLDAEHHDLARLLGGTTGDDVDKFAGIGHEEGPGGAPILVDCQDRLVLQRIGMWDDGGDHVCFVGEPIDVTVGEIHGEPLRVSDAQDVDPGHDSHETIP
jgi:flavin reductase (DIM6/NTAB) family NADH-FMN oxidoreductase RutF